MKEAIARKVVRIFVGSGDFSSQNSLVKKRKRQGWAVAPYDNSPEIVDAVYNAQNAIVVANGADARLCVAAVVDDSFNRGARRVIVPLDKIRTANETQEPLFSRALALARGLAEKRRKLDDPRLLVTPRSTWQKAVKQVKKEDAY